MSFGIAHGEGQYRASLVLHGWLFNDAASNVRFIYQLRRGHRPELQAGGKKAVSTRFKLQFHFPRFLEHLTTFYLMFTLFIIE
jgi:hypothetical protein